MKDKKEVGNELRRLRGNRTIEESAKAIGISKSALAMYERGERSPRDEVKIRIADYYKKPIQKIFF
mgnify:CR=1 FL=1